MTTTSKFNAKSVAADTAAALRAHNAATLKTIRAKTEAPKVRRTRVAKAVDDSTIKAEAPNVETTESAYARYTERLAFARDDLLASFKVPTPTRVVVATVSHLLALSVTLYWGVEATTALMAAAFVLTSSAFITWVLGFMGLVLAVYSALVAGRAIGSFVLGFDYGKCVDTGRDLRVAAAKKISLVKGWFTRSTPEEVTA